MATNSGDNEPIEDINAEISRFLQKLREDDPDAASAPEVAAPPRVKKAAPTPVVVPAGDPAVASEAPQKPAKAVRAPRAPKVTPVAAKPTAPAPQKPPRESGKRLRALFTRPAQGNGSRPTKKIILLAAAATVVAAASYTALSVSSLTISEGITTNRGPGNGQTVLIDKTTIAEQGDLVVGVMPGTSGTDDEKYVMGTVFSANDQTYAVYDGNVVWQVPISELKGKVLFATPADIIPGN